MKVMAFNARPDERAFFDHFSQSAIWTLRCRRTR